MKLQIFGSPVVIKEMDLSKLEILGFYDPEKNIIGLEQTLKGEERMETLIHEVIHALAYRLSWRQAIPQALEEIMCDQIARVITENFEIKRKHGIRKTNKI